MMPDPLDVAFDFERRPTPVPPDLRPEWRIASLLLALHQCWGNRANRRQLHVLNWAMRTSEAQAAFINIIAGNVRPDEAIVRFDPVVDRALQFAEGESLVKASGELIMLTDKGDRFVKELMGNKECMASQKQFLKSLGGKLTQMKVDAFLSTELR